MKFTYCPDCGTKLIQKEIGDEGLMPYCENCKKPLFDMFSTCIIALVVNEYGEAPVERLRFVGTYWFGKKDMLMIGFIAEAKKRELKLSGEVDAAEWVDASRAIDMVHPGGSVSYALLEYYLKEQESIRQKGSSL